MITLPLFFRFFCSLYQIKVSVNDSGANFVKKYTIHTFNVCGASYTDIYPSVLLNLQNFATILKIDKNRGITV